MLMFNSDFKREANLRRVYTITLALFSLVFFARSFSSYFVCDDFQFLGRVNFSNAGAYLTKTWGYGNEYRPFLPYTYALDGLVSGDRPYGYHATNTLLHVTNSLLLARLALLIGLSAEIAAWGGLIHLLNPVAHEAFLWISGRPVVLSTFFVLACVNVFLSALRQRQPPTGLWVAVYLLFILGLATYELAIVTPLLAAFLVCFAKEKVHSYRNHIVALLAIAGAYAVFWIWFFDFRFTRIRIEHSFLQIAINFGAALAHTLHGSLRPEIGVVYLLLWAILCRTHRGRWLSLAGLIGFAIAYLPYFATKGYADRFAYLSSAATAIVLAASLTEGIGTRKYLRYGLAALFLAYLATGMQNRISAWKEAGEIARAVQVQVKETLPVFPSEREVVLLDVPLMHKRSYVYLTSLDRALERQYPGTKIHFRTSIDSSIDDSAIILQYSTGRMVRRTLAEVKN